MEKVTIFRSQLIILIIIVVQNNDSGYLSLSLRGNADNSLNIRNIQPSANATSPEERQDHHQQVELGPKVALVSLLLRTAA